MSKHKPSLAALKESSPTTAIEGLFQHRRQAKHFPNTFLFHPYSSVSVNSLLLANDTLLAPFQTEQMMEIPAQVTALNSCVVIVSKLLIDTTAPISPSINL